MHDTVKDLQELLGGNDLRATAKKAIMENSDLRKQVEGFVAERTAHLAKEVKEAGKVMNGVNVYTLTGVRLPDVVKNVAFIIRKECPEQSVFIAATSSEGRPTLTLMLSDDLVKAGYNASQIIREAAKLIKGGGGGQPFFAQAGGKDASNLTAAADKMKELLGLI